MLSREHDDLVPAHLYAIGYHASPLPDLDIRRPVENHAALFYQMAIVSFTGRQLHGMRGCMAQLSMAVRAWEAEGDKEPARLLVVLDEELAGLELVWVHHVQQLPPCGVVFLRYSL